MKKILLLLVVLAFTQVVIAQNLDIALIEYIPETNYARIQISNNLPQDLHNVKYQIDAFSPKKVTSTLKAGAITTRVLNIGKGVHTVTVTSDEITESKELSFEASLAEEQAAFSQEERDRRRTVQREKVFQQELEKNAPIVKQKKPYLKYFIILIILTIIGAVAYFLLLLLVLLIL